MSVKKFLQLVTVTAIIDNCILLNGIYLAQNIEFFYNVEKKVDLRENALKLHNAK